MQRFDLCTFAAVVFLVLVITGWCRVCPAASHTYLQIQKDGKLFFDWRLVEQEGQVRIVSSNDAVRYVNVCLPTGETLEWKMKGPEVDIRAVRHGRSLVIQGTRQGKAYEHKQAVGELPWRQPLSFSLRPLLDGKRTDCRFWMIHPESLKVHKLFAESGPSESVSIKGREYAARRIDVSLNRWTRSFWKASYWFRASDGLFLRFEGRDGVFGDPIQIKLVD